jgi:bifunctional DNA-binding transcriptional regulator/antitoxin component of YhaV-PrlF toxin-antitoxin module
MRRSAISQGGQISIPAEVRRRWGTSNIVIEDKGSALLIRPVPDDPIGAAVGSLRGRGPTTDEMRARVRDEETARDARRGARP